MKIVLQSMIVWLIITIVNSIPVDAQEAFPNCQMLPTEYPYLTRGFDWENDDSVIFQVNNGVLRNDDITVRQTAWYRFIPSSSELNLLDVSPYDLDPISERQYGWYLVPEEGPLGTYEYVHVSPSRTKIIYVVNIYEQPHYHLVDLIRGEIYFLWIEFRPYTPIEVSWSSDETIALITGSVNSVFPSRTLRFDDQNLTVEYVINGSPFREMGISVQLSGFWHIGGISPTGRYFVIAPTIIEPKSQLVDLELQEIRILDFWAISDLLWLSPSTFMTRIDGGIIEYDLETNVITPIELTTYSPITMLSSVTFAPDGKSLIGHWYYYEPTVPNIGVWFCRIRD